MQNEDRLMNKQIKTGTSTQEYQMQRQMMTQFAYFAPTPATATTSNVTMNQWQD
jgi:hypothetical protein